MKKSGLILMMPVAHKSPPLVSDALEVQTSNILVILRPLPGFP